MRAGSILAISALILALGATDVPVPAGPASSSFIVRAPEGTAARAVLEVGGEITHELEIIGAVGARLTRPQVRRLAGSPGVTLFPDRSVRAAAAVATAELRPETDYPALVGATALHRQNITGRGVTVAVLDTGIWSHPGLTRNTRGQERLLAGVSFSPETAHRDLNGHGTHVAGTIVDSQGAAGRWNGVAPDAALVVIKAFDREGVGSYAGVIAGIQWAVEHRERFGIRVLNLSFSAAPLSHYWDDPLAQAVMQAWRAGLVVVTSAGNLGPEAMTVGIPGNVPYVITVGAMSDAVTPTVGEDDYLTSFSASGPTLEGFVKPEVVAPGGHVRALMHRDGRIAREHVEYHDDAGYFTMSGTSQSAAVVSGVAALLLQAQPWLTPDELKCRLMEAARPAVDEHGRLAYSVLRQGAGLVDAAAALESSAGGCANRGLDIDLDLAGARHFGGRARLDAAGEIVVAGLELAGSGEDEGGGRRKWSGGYLWSGGLGWADAVEWEQRLQDLGGYGWGDGERPSWGFGWGDGSVEQPASAGFGWGDSFGYGWGDGTVPPEAGFGWGDGSAPPDAGYGWGDGASLEGYLWSESPAVAINPWVEQE